LLGSIFSGDQKEYKDIIILEPPKSISYNYYRCDAHFHTESIASLYQSHDNYGIIHIDGQETVFYVLNGIALTRIERFIVQLPRNHDKGGQSQNRIERLRQEKIFEYLKKISEKAQHHYLTDAHEVNIKGLVIVGVAQKKDQICEHLDSRLKDILLGILTDTQVSVTRICNLISGKDRIDADAEYQKLLDLIRTSSDTIRFGKIECTSSLDEGLLKLLYCDQHTTLLQDRCDATGCTLIPLGDRVNQYGGQVGVLWFNY
jgi:peptide subunit release factor 1 (eRF1)